MILRAGSGSVKMAFTPTGIMNDEGAGSDIILNEVSKNLIGSIAGDESKNFFFPHQL